MARDRIHFSDIEVNAYDKTIEEELAVYSPGGLPGHLAGHVRHPRVRDHPQRDQDRRAPTRASPTTTGARPTSRWARKRPPSAWPFSLTPDDHIYGSHRSHGEILAKGFSAIRKIDDATLLEIMRSYLDGAILRPLEKGHRGSVRDLALKFLIYGAYSEIFARETGFNRGMGGSMHAFFTPFGIYPNNAIVGGSGSIAPGAALFKRVNRKPGIVVANIGDASFGCGPVWEGITFARMDQYRTLWDQALGGGLPIIFNCMNNLYGMGGQPLGETMGCQFIARIGAGVNPEQMHAERVNGYDPLAVIDAFRRKMQDPGGGQGPGAARHGDLPHQRALALGRLQLPVQGGDREVAGGRFAPRLPGQAGRGAASSRRASLDETRAGTESVVFEMFQLATDLGGGSADCRSTPSWSAR